MNSITTEEKERMAEFRSFWDSHVEQAKTEMGKVPRMWWCIFLGGKRTGV